MEIIVADAMSADGTRDRIAQYPQVRLVDNPEQVTPVALNRAIAAARGEIILRMDAHARIAPDYVSGCVDALLQTGADNVGGRRIELAQDQGMFSDAIVAALSHPFGVGNAHYRMADGEPSWVDTVFGGCWRRELFDRVGYFNPKLARSQDMEFNGRLRRAGGKILLCPRLVVYYYSRSRLRDLVRHNFRNGAWAVLPFCFSDSSMPVGIRHLVPMAMVVAVAAGCAVGFYWPAIVYAAANVAASAHVAWSKRSGRLALKMPLVFASLHFSYGLGSCWGAVRAFTARLATRRKQRGGFDERHSGSGTDRFFDGNGTARPESQPCADGDAARAVRLGGVAGGR